MGRGSRFSASSRAMPPEPVAGVMVAAVGTSAAGRATEGDPHSSGVISPEVVAEVISFRACVVGEGREVMVSCEMVITRERRGLGSGKTERQLYDTLGGTLGKVWYLHDVSNVTARTRNQYH